MIQRRRQQRLQQSTSLLNPFFSFIGAFFFFSLTLLCCLRHVKAFNAVSLSLPIPSGKALSLTALSLAPKAASSSTATSALQLVGTSSLKIVSDDDNDASAAANAPQQALLPSSSSLSTSSTPVITSPRTTSLPSSFLTHKALPLGRRVFMLSTIAAVVCGFGSHQALAAGDVTDEYGLPPPSLLPSFAMLPDDPTEEELPLVTITLPLEAFGGAYATLFAIDGQVFRGLVDTGSPFLSVDRSCNRMWGCYTNEGEDAGLPDTFENFVGRGGEVHWRRGLLTLSSGADPTFFFAYRAVFGLLPVQLTRSMSGGGVFIGLVKRKQPDIRPTFLGQTDIAAMKFDFPGRRLVLSRQPLIPAGTDAVPLLDMMAMGDPVNHYCAKVTVLKMNGIPCFTRYRDVTRAKRKMVCIIDTGMTGLALSSELFDFAVDKANAVGENPFRTMEVQLKTERSTTPLSLKAKNPITTSVTLPWKGFANIDVVVLGLAFLDGGELTIDVDSDRMTFVRSGEGLYA